MSATVTPVIGLPQQRGWSQVIQAEQSPLVVALAVVGQNAGNVGRDLADHIREATPHDATELHAFLHHLQTEVTNKDCEWSMAAILHQPDHAILAAYQSVILLKRGEKVGRLLDRPAELHVVAGGFYPEDVFVLVTSQAESLLGEIQQKLTQGYDVDTIVTSVVPGVHSLPDSSGAALAFLSPTPEREITPEFMRRSETETEESVTEIGSYLSDVSAVEDAPETEQVEPWQGPTTTFESHEKFEAERPLMNSLPPFSSDESPELDSVVPSAVAPTVLTAEPTSLSLRSKAVIGTLARIGSKLTHGLGRVLQPATRLVGGSGAVYVTTNRRPWLRKLVVVLVGVAVIAALGLNWYLNRSKTLSEVQAKLVPLQESLVVAQAQYEQDPIAARDQVQQLIVEASALESEYAKQKVAVNEVREFKQTVEAYYQDISGREEVQALPVFYDLRNADSASDFITTAADVRDNIAYFLDGERRQLIRLDLETKQQQTYNFGEGARLTDVAALDDGALVLGENLLRVTENAETEPLVVRPAEDQLKNSVRVDVFGQSAYVVSPKDNTIFSYTPSDNGGYSDPKNWLQSRGDFKLENIISMKIDGDIWLTNSEGQIAIFRSGRPQAFSMRGVPEELTNSLRLFTTEESDNLYVLDSDHQRLVILSKNGDFIREVSSGSLAAGSHLLVSEDLNSAFVVSGSTVYQISLGEGEVTPAAEEPAEE